MLTALGFMLINLASYFWCLRKGPFWGLIAYINIYFNAPNPSINWWAEFLPFSKWSLATSIVLVFSLFIHWKKTSNHNFRCAKWAFFFCILSLFVTFTSAFNEDNAYRFQYFLFSYCLIVFIIIKSIAHEKQLRAFLLVTIALATNLSLNAYLYGERVNNRLEGIGTSDAFGSNEFALLLASILPFIVVFLRNGGFYEKLISFVSIPFILNAFILCNSRGAAVALILGLAISTFLVGDKNIRIGVVVAAILATPVFYFLMDDAFKERFATLLDAGDAYGDEERSNQLSSGRIAIWNYGVEMAKDYPFGVGPDGFKDMAHIYMPPEILTYWPGRPYGRRAAHNTYLQVLVEQGLLGLGVWLIMCFCIIASLRRQFRSLSADNDADKFLRNTLFALTVSFLTTLAGGLVTSRVYFEFFWWQIALVVVVTSLAKKTTERDSSADQALAK